MIKSKAGTLEKPRQQLYGGRLHVEYNNRPRS